VGIELLADHPELTDVLATLQWEEWGRDADEPLEEWIAITRQDVGRAALPFGFVALEDGAVVGGVSLRDHDIPQMRDRSPWVCGMLVRADRRGQGIGCALMARLEEHAVRAGFNEAWVWTGAAPGFYERCGWVAVASLFHENVMGTVLQREFGSR
jgi:GNAT superfamily N-acetyltransferase